MKDYHVEQFNPRTPCSGKNCAAASGAMAVYFGTRGHQELTADEFRHRADVSCVPGVHSATGGLFISDVERVCAAYGVSIDYGRASKSYYRRWNTTELRTRLGTYWGGVIQGMYGNIPAPWRASGSTFTGGHSAWAHDYREDMPDSHFDKIQPTYCWGDPLRKRHIRVPAAVLEHYSQSDTPLKGFAGFVKIPPIPGGVYASPMTDRTRTAYATVAVHDERTTGKASTVRVIRGKGKLVEVAMYANGAAYHHSKEWGALSLLGDEWVHLKRLDHVRGDT